MKPLLLSFDVEEFDFLESEDEQYKLPYKG